MRAWLILAYACVPLLCGRKERATVARDAIQPVSSTESPRQSEGPIRMEALVPTAALGPGAAPPTFVMRGAPKGADPIVFLHGMCGHALGYAQSFQHGAAEKGTLIAPQGDVSCGGPWSKWSSDLVALDARIVGTFRALGHQDPAAEVVVIGYSQGAQRAEALARKWPLRYTRLILMGAPVVPSPRGLASLRGAVMMAGERDRQDLMRAGARALAAANIPSTFMIIPEATHGAMGPTPEKTMQAALDWLWTHAKPRATPAAERE